MKKFLMLAKSNCYFGYLVCFVISLLTEIFIFNGDNLYLSSDYEKYEVNLPFNDTLKQNAVVLSSENRQLVVNSLNLNLANVYIETKGPNVYVKGKVLLSDKNYAYRLNEINHFALNPGGENNKVTVRAEGFGNVSRVAVAFDDLRAPIIVSKLVLNQEPSLNFSFVRLLLTFIAYAFIYLTFVQKIFYIPFDAAKKTHKIANYGLIVFSVLVPFYIMTGYFGENTNPIYYSYYQGAGAFPMTNPEHSILVNMPTTAEEIKNNADIYVKQMDAFNKGQLNIDYPVDQRLLQLDNILDYSERMAKNVYGLYDLSLYNNAWYSYFGLSPLLFYYPVYWLTGKAPALPFSLGIITCLTILSLALAYNKLFKYYELKSSLGLFLLGEATLLFGSFVLCFQEVGTFYSLKYLFNFISMSLLLVCLTALITDLKPKFKNLLLICSGVLIVLIVHSRPSTMLIPMFYSVPVIYIAVKKYGLLKFIKPVLIYAGIPTLLGAVFTMWYNYARFDSIFEIGMHYQLSMFDVRLMHFNWSWDMVSDFIYHVFTEPFGFDKYFPYFHLQNAVFEDFGFYHYLNSRGGLNAFPAIYLLLLVVFLFRKNTDGKIASISTDRGLLFVSGSLLAVLASLITVFAGYNIIGGYILYNTEILWCLILFAFMVTFKFAEVSDLASPAGKVVLAVIILVSVKTIVFSILLPFDFNVLRDADPDFYLNLQYAFEPFHY